MEENDSGDNGACYRITVLAIRPKRWSKVTETKYPQVYPHKLDERNKNAYKHDEISKEGWITRYSFGVLIQ
jgi:hypothetical protein